MRARELLADLIREWATRQAKASAKLEGRELPDGFVRSVQAQQFLNMRKAGKPASQRPMSLEEFMATGWHPDD